MSWKDMSRAQKDAYNTYKSKWSKKWRAENPDKAKELDQRKNIKRLSVPGARAKQNEWSRKYRKENPERQHVVDARSRAKMLAMPGVREKRIAANKAWRAAYPERKNAGDRAWKAANPEKNRLNNQRHSRKCVEELRDAYIVHRLGGPDVATPELVEVKRLHIKIHRLLKGHTK